MTDGYFNPTPEEAIDTKASGRTYPRYVRTWIHGGRFDFVDPTTTPTLSIRWDFDRNRGLAYDENRRIVSLFLEERREHYDARVTGSPTDDIPEIDLRRLPKGVDAESIVPHLMEWGILPYVDHDLIPE